jgi:hypothetical protein
MSIATFLYYRTYILHTCPLFIIMNIFLYSIYIMGTRRRFKKRTVKNKRRNTYKKRGGFWNDPASELPFKWVTDPAPYTSSSK